MSSLFVLPKPQAAQLSGIPYAAAKLYFFEAGTTTDQDVYQDINLATPHAQPVEANDSGFFPPIYLDPESGNFRVQLKTSAGALIYDVDNIPSTTVTSGQIIAATTPLNAAEIAAGYTEANSNTSYPYGDIRRSGALLDGTTDDTAAVTRWASLTGNLTYPVVATAKITTAIPLLTNTTIKAVQGATIRQYTANASVLTADTKTDIVIEGLTLYAVGSLSSYYNGTGISLSQCERVTVKGCTVTNHRGWGILLDRCVYGEVSGNRLINASVGGATDHSDISGDIALLDTNRVRVIGNECVSGNGVGIQVQTVQTVGSCRRNVVIGNVIRNCLMYGISLYRGGSGTTHDGTVVVGNSIDNVSGAIPEATDGLVFGAGIYAVQASNFVIEGNEISDTHSGVAVVDLIDSLAAGAIGTTFCGAHTIRGNVIRTAGYNGITVRNPDGGSLGDHPVVVEGNVIDAAEKYGLEVQDRGNISILGNQIHSTDSTGLIVYAPTLSTKRPAIVVEGNVVKNAGATGILVNYGTAPVVANNKVDTADEDGLSVQNSDDAVISGNSVSGAGVGAYGIANYQTSARASITGNQVRGTGAAPAYGYYFGGSWRPNRTNISSNVLTAAAFGDYIPDVASAPVAGTWAVGDTVASTNPAGGGFIGWICTVAGTPGTWTTYGAVTP